jgi:hypothetical protein
MVGARMDMVIRNIIKRGSIEAEAVVVIPALVAILIKVDGKALV